jgi:hypothetical protein
MKKKKLISLDEKDIKKIEEIALRNNLNFSQAIKYLLDNYEDRLSKHIVRSNENLEILNIYFNVFKTQKIEAKNLEKLIEYLIKAGDAVNKIKIKKLKELKTVGKKKKEQKV